MKASEAAEQIQAIIDYLEEAKGELELNDTSDFDIGRELTSIQNEVEKITDYIEDQVWSVQNAKQRATVMK